MRCIIIFLSILTLSGCSYLFYHPDSNFYFEPKAQGFAEPEEIRFNSKDGTPLWGWFFAAKKPSKGLVIQFHGNAENLTSHYLFLAWMTQEGYDLFIFDYRGYGESDGRPSQEGTYLDGKAALDWAWKRWKGKKQPGKFVVFGQSLGGAIATRALCDFPHSKDVSLMVEDSTFASYPRVAKGLLTQKWFLWPFSWLPWLVVSNEYGTADCLQKNKVPLLVIHDEKDRKVRFENGEEVFSLATSQKQFWKLDDGVHCGAFNVQHEARRREFVKFLDDLVH